MKKRFSFVSNSSSTSFCVVGIIFPLYGEEYEYSNSAKGLLKIYKDYLKNKKEDFTIQDYIYNKINEQSQCKLIIQRGISNYSDEDIILGFDIENIEDQQTFCDFKQKICDHINTCFELDCDDKFKKEDLSIFVDGGYDG